MSAIKHDGADQNSDQTISGVTSMTTKRKLKLAMDAGNDWRVKMFAEREGRSLTSAANALVASGYAAWFGDRSDAAAVANAKPDEPPISTSVPRNILLPLTLVDELHRVARADKRTMSSLIRALIREALDARRKKIDHIDTGHIDNSGDATK
jgi:hypothetical protein